MKQHLEGRNRHKVEEHHSKQKKLLFHSDLGTAQQSKKTIVVSLYLPLFQLLKAKSDIYCLFEGKIPKIQP